MRGSLGEKIGEGASAEVHAWAPGQVVKLFRSESSRRLGWHEAHMTDAVFAAGAPAPQVFGVVILEGRLGIVLERFDGPTLLQLTRTGGVTRGQAGAILADLCRAVHRTPPPPGVLALRGWMDAWLRSAGGTLPAPIAPGILALIERLRPADELCHGDLHPGNVIMTAEGPRTRRLERDGPRARRLRSWDQPHPSDRARPGNRRRSGAAARGQCGRAVRVRAAGRPVACGARGGDRVLPACRPHLGRAGKRVSPRAGATAPARRSGPAARMTEGACGRSPFIPTIFDRGRIRRTQKR